MGFVGDIAGKIGNQFGFGGGANQFQAQTPINSFAASGIQNGFQAQQAYMPQQDYGAGIQGAMGLGTGGAMDQQQSSFADTLRARMNGTAGPSLAELQLQQGLQANQQMAAGSVASQRGINPAMAARLIGQNQSNMGQETNAQAAQLRAQEQMGATGMLGSALAAQRAQQQSQMGQNTNLLGTLGGLQQGQNALALQNFQGAQGLNAQVAGQNAGLMSHAQDVNAMVAGGNQQAQLDTNRVNAGVAAQNANISSNQWGSLLGGAGSVLGKMASGGEVPSTISLDDPMSYIGLRSNVADHSSGWNELGSKLGSMGAAAIQSGAIAASGGGDVPGHAVARGDNQKNDVVHALLSPHEIVLPRSVTLADDAPERARDFVRAIKGRMKGKTLAREQTVMAEGGEVKAEKSAPGPIDRFKQLFTRDSSGAQSSPSVFDTAGAVKEHNKKLEDTANAEKMADGGDVSDPWIDPMSGNPSPLPTMSDADRAALVRDAPLGMLKGFGIETPTPDQTPASQGPGMLARPADADMVSARPQAPAPQQAPAGQPKPAANEMAGGERQQIAGIQGEATAAQSFAKAQTGIMDSWNAERMDLHGKLLQAIETQKTEADANFRMMMDPKNDVNPNRWWDQKSTGGKIAASIGMILGGMPAVENINKAIANDIEAQKLNIGRKDNAINRHMQAGRDYQTSIVLASADMKDAAAAQLARASAAYSGTKAASDAQVQIGALRQSAFQQRQQATLADFQIRNASLNAQFMQRMMEHMNSGGANTARDLQTMGFMQHPEKFAETQVNTQEDVPTGATDTEGRPLTQTATTAYRGKSTQAMEKASEALSHNRVMDTSLKELETFEKENPLGGTPGSEAVGRARAAVQNIRLNYEATMAGMNRQASPEVIKHMEDIVKDPTVLFKSGKTSGALKFLRKMINEHKQSVLDTYTLGKE